VDTAEARAILGLPLLYTTAELDAAFRHHASEAHPDRHGDIAQFHAVVESRRVLTDGARPGRVTATNNTPRIIKWTRQLRRRPGSPRHLL
jgi:hypothetical protein